MLINHDFFLSFRTWRHSQGVSSYLLKQLKQFSCEKLKRHLASRTLLSETDTSYPTENRRSNCIEILSAGVRE